MHNYLLENNIEKLKQINTIDEYETFIRKFIQALRQENYKEETIQIIRNKGKYTTNKFSDKAAMESMFRAKENLLFYLEGLLSEKQENSSQSCCRQLETYLCNFYLFLEAFKETQPDKRASITTESLQKIKIENEYDLQHLLYAVLKPLYIDIRKEVTEDSGLGAIRSDLLIPSLNAIIESKYTRKSMSQKKLSEELEADIVHYNADFIYFYIYDKEKLIKNRHTFESYFNRSFDGKRVKIFILQPVNM